MQTERFVITLCLLLPLHGLAARMDGKVPKLVSRQGVMANSKLGGPQGFSMVSRQGVTQSPRLGAKLVGVSKVFAGVRSRLGRMFARKSTAKTPLSPREQPSSDAGEMIKRRGRGGALAHVNKLVDYHRKELDTASEWLHHIELSLVVNPNAVEAGVRLADALPRFERNFREKRDNFHRAEELRTHVERQLREPPPSWH